MFHYLSEHLSSEEEFYSRISYFLALSRTVPGIFFQLGVNCSKSSTPWKKALFEKLTLTHVVNKFSELFGTVCSVSCPKQPDSGSILSQANPLHTHHPIS
jgi:hypothetical protein